MYVFSQQFVVRGDPRQTLSWAREVTALANRKTELAGSLWSGLLGAPVGTLAVSTLVQSQPELAAVMERLQGDSEYLDLVMSGYHHLTAPPESTLLEILHAAGPDHQRAPVGAICAITSAEISPGCYAEAGRWGVEIAELVAGITGRAVLFGRQVAGSFGGVQWITTPPDLATSESDDQQVNKDGAYLAKLAEIRGLFVAGSGRRLLGKRIA